MNDLLVVSHGTYEVHLKEIKTVCQWLAKAGLKCEINKCKFAEIEYLGYIITTEGIKPNLKKVQAILDIQLSITKRGSSFYWCGIILLWSLVQTQWYTVAATWFEYAMQLNDLLLRVYGGLNSRRCGFAVQSRDGCLTTAVTPSRYTYVMVGRGYALPSREAKLGDFINLFLQYPRLFFLCLQNTVWNSSFDYYIHLKKMITRCHRAFCSVKILRGRQMVMKRRESSHEQKRGRKKINDLYWYTFREVVDVWNPQIWKTVYMIVVEQWCN